MCIDGEQKVPLYRFLTPSLSVILSSLSLNGSADVSSPTGVIVFFVSKKT